MRDPELVARAGYAATRLEQAWQRWRALHGLAGSSDPLASYVGYSLKEPMGQPRVVIGVDATEAEYFADFLESHDCAAVAQVEPRPAGRPQDTPDPLVAELAGWVSGELPGQASEQLANWAAAESASATTMDRTMDRSRTER